MAIGKIDFDGYPYIAYYLIHTLDGECPIYGELRVPKNLDSRSTIIAHFKKTPINYLVEVSHLPFETVLFGDVKHRLSTTNGNWYKDKAGKYVNVRVTRTEKPTEIKDDRAYD